VRILVVSGIWPPDVGGPATHAPELAEELLARGHSVEVVITAERAPTPERYPVRWSSRRLPRGIRHVASTLAIFRAARRADVTYATGMIVRSSLATAAARVPLVAKLTSDPSFERAVRYGLYVGDLGVFQEQRGFRLGVLRRIRNVALRHVAHFVVPSAALRELAYGWGISAEQITLLPNPVAVPEGLAERAELRRRHGLEGRTLVFAGRLVPQKRVDVALEALAQAEDVTLLIAGDGPDEAELRQRVDDLGLDGRARFLGPQPREAVFELLRAADGAVLSSSWENFPHVAVEALAVGTPVVATAVGGVSEIVRDGENGLLVPPDDPPALAAAIRRYFDDSALREQLRGEAAASVGAFAPERVYEQLEAILMRAARV
jgi:glycosyltransferase involved in cell wall biosynthesis